jgi:hypothetical protein
VAAQPGAGTLAACAGDRRRYRLARVGLRRRVVAGVGAAPKVPGESVTDLPRHARSRREGAVMKTTLCGLAAAAAALALLSVCAAAPDKPDRRDEASLWMTRKLEYSQKVLAGLTAGDFEKVRKNADAMLVVGYLEKWDRGALPEYRRQLKSFDAANKELIRKARDKDVRAATKAYTQLIVSCVECHAVVRDAKKGK